MRKDFKPRKNRDGLHLVWFGMAILVIPWIVQRVHGIEHYLDVMVFAGILSLATIGLSLLMGFAGQISLGHASFLGLGAYISGIVTTKYGINPWYCVLLGMAVSAMVALLIGAPSLKLRGHYLAMATLAFCIIVTVVFNESIALTGGPDGLAFIPGIAVLGCAVDSVVKYYYFVWSMVAGVMLLGLNIIQSRVGRALRSIHASETAASAVGVNVAKYKICVFILSAVLASVSGSLYAHYLNFINPSSFDLFVSIKLIIMIILGGMHSLWGAIVGAALITFLSYEWLHYFEEAEVMVYGAIVLLIVIFLPEGVISIPQRLWGLWGRVRLSAKGPRLKTEP